MYKLFIETVTLFLADNFYRQAQSYSLTNIMFGRYPAIHSIPHDYVICLACMEETRFLTFFSVYIVQCSRDRDNLQESTPTYTSFVSI